MHEHQWVKMLSIDVKVIPSLDDGVALQTMLEEDIEKALDEAVVGCKNCNVLLNTKTAYTECLPPGITRSFLAAFRHGFNRDQIL